MPAKSQTESLPHLPVEVEDAQRAERPAATTLERHVRKCSICRHPDREAIEADFIHWRSEDTIRYEFSLGSRSSIYRHAAATGLLERRRLNLRGVCERIIERAEEAPPSATAILRAVRIFAHITEDGQWVESAKRSIVTHIHITQHEPPPAIANDAAGALSSDSSPQGDTVTQACPPGREPASNSDEPPQAGHSACPEACPLGQEPAVRPSSPGPSDKSIDNSENGSPESFPGEITVNTRRNKRLPWRFHPEILIGQQNASPETISNGEHST